MTSVSSASQIRNRTQLYLMKIPENTYIQKPQDIIALFFRQLSMEYDIIPEKERIGKASVYISKYVAKEFPFYNII